MNVHRLSNKEVQRLTYNWNRTGELDKLCPKCGKMMYWLVGSKCYTCHTYGCNYYLERIYPDEKVVIQDSSTPPIWLKKK